MDLFPSIRQKGKPWCIISPEETPTGRFVGVESELFTEDEQLDRLHGPIGLRLGGKTPEEIALSVLVEIIAVQNQVIK